MKTFLRFVALLNVVLFASATSAFAQGSLTPPGAPAPTMKSLEQIEARTPISAAPFTISTPGSYYLTGNVTVTSGDALTIAASGVTLDLNGYTVSSTAASAGGGGIQINSALRNLTIKNGFIESGVTNNGSGTYSGSGFTFGITYSGNAPVNVLVSRMSVAGVRNDGINLARGNSTVVEACSVRTAGGVGISASVIKGSAAADCGSHAIYGEEVTDSRGESAYIGYGILASTANNCYGISSSGLNHGLGGGTANNCYGQSSVSFGLFVTVANNCYGQSSSGAYGLYAVTANNCHGVNSTGIGLSAYTASNCYGVSSGGQGILATNAQGCYGISSTSEGVLATSASNCFGESTFNRGVSAEMATSCWGRCLSGGSYGVIVTHMANACYGYSKSGIGVAAYIAIGCRGETSSGTPVGATYKYNMP